MRRCGASASGLTARQAGSSAKLRCRYCHEVSLLSIDTCKRPLQREITSCRRCTTLPRRNHQPPLQFHRLLLCVQTALQQTRSRSSQPLFRCHLASMLKPRSREPRTTQREQQGGGRHGLLPAEQVQRRALHCRPQALQQASWRHCRTPGLTHMWTVRRSSGRRSSHRTVSAWSSAMQRLCRQHSRRPRSINWLPLLALACAASLAQADQAAGERLHACFHASTAP